VDTYRRRCTSVSGAWCFFSWHLTFDTCLRMLHNFCLCCLHCVYCLLHRVILNYVVIFICFWSILRSIGCVSRVCQLLINEHNNDDNNDESQILRACASGTENFPCSLCWRVSDHVRWILHQLISAASQRSSVRSQEMKTVETARKLMNERMPSLRNWVCG